ncbi:PadR family transcriptional regulator [Rhodospira trueperi]|uniref:DNA-binding transcriptional regulator, PadR family n=1 Tax=Rhodospira trueperi TaxID=69960 RepID=A0A1G7DIH8_9PROT|nr:PadR family transcriptional regulator [Rhodospira trueperi]SDE50886.1 DNA-binding transcriptional regulator, PadR family [Rhodospira trueperi]
MPLDSKTLCLGALDAGFNTGYDIRKAFENGPFQHYQSLSYGSIYPALNALLAEGLVTCRPHSQDGRPDKKVYTITEAGRSALRAALLQPLEFDRLRSGFMFALSFAHRMAPGELSRLLDDYIRGHYDLADELARIDGVTTPGDRFLIRMGADVCRAWGRWIEENRAALEHDIQAYRTARVPLRDGTHG